MNKVILMGRLTRDPDVRHGSGENATSVARYTLAVDRKRNKEGEQAADFVSCVAFSKNAEFAETYLKQGIKIAVIGRIQTGSYTNKDGVKVYTTDVVVEECEFAEKKGSTDGNPYRSSPTTSSDDGDGFMNIPDGLEDDGLPF